MALDVASAESAESAESTAAFGRSIDGTPFDIALLAAGAYGPRTTGLVPPADADFDLVMRSNVLGAMRVLPLAAGALVPGGRLVVLSSRMGSIASRGGTDGWL